MARQADNGEVPQKNAVPQILNPPKVNKSMFNKNNVEMFK